MRVNTPPFLAAFVTVMWACERPPPTADQLDVEALPSLVAVEDLRVGSAEDPELGFSRI